MSNLWSMNLNHIKGIMLYKETQRKAAQGAAFRSVPRHYRGGRSGAPSVSIAWDEVVLRAMALT